MVVFAFQSLVFEVFVLTKGWGFWILFLLCLSLHYNLWIALQDLQQIGSCSFGVSRVLELPTFIALGPVEIRELR